MSGFKYLFIVNEAAFFVSHRINLALELKRRNLDVALIFGHGSSDEMESGAIQKLNELDIEFDRVSFRSSRINPFYEVVGLLQVILAVFRSRPDMVHCVSQKGIVYGGIASRICRVPALVLAISGMGYLATAIPRSLRESAILYLITSVYYGFAKFVFRHPNAKIIVQNNDDRMLIINKKLADERKIVLIPGSGVDLALYETCNVNAKSKVVLLPARMLTDKGVFEFFSAAKEVLGHFSDWQFLLAGAADYDNPSGISSSEITSWTKTGMIEWLGYVPNMQPLYCRAAIVCLPSYREGMPKSLLEAAAAGCAVVTTDVTGCREAIEPGVTGDLVPPRDSHALAKALLSLIKDKSRRQRYGAKGQERAQGMFSVESVVRRTIEIYKGLLGDE